MSRIGNMPVAIPAAVEIDIAADNTVTVKGPKGSLTQRLSPRMRLQRDNGTILVERPDNQREHRSLHGLTRSLLNNMVVGVTDGYKRDL
ncbi:MAG TPA: 50S ribosomal protein L6, partial [Thermomicrobiales bacterium]|nr:50S ribosomal protein L6 [Thermomicrobiales bacterium]